MVRQKFTRVKTARGRKISSTKWLQRQLNDPYVLRAREEGYASRAAYKLLEINDKFHIINYNSLIADLGAAPGGWTQVAVKLSNSSPKNPKIVSIDLQDMEDIKGARIIKGDFLEEFMRDRLLEVMGGRNFSAVLSDMSPKTTGHHEVDHLGIIELCENALVFAEDNLSVGGSFVSKILQGTGTDELIKNAKMLFRKVKLFKPNSSRPESTEIYLVACDFKGKKT